MFFSPAIISRFLVLRSPVIAWVKQMVFMFLFVFNRDSPISFLYFWIFSGNLIIIMSPIMSYEVGSSFIIFSGSKIFSL